MRAITASYTHTHAALVRPQGIIIILEDTTLIFILHCKKYPDENHFGSSCYVTLCDSEGVNAYSYIPVQIIASHCCFGKLNIDLLQFFCLLIWLSHSKYVD